MSLHSRAKPASLTWSERLHQTLKRLQQWLQGDTQHPAMRQEMALIPIRHSQAPVRRPNQTPHWRD